MANSSPNKLLVARAAAILTNAEVKTPVFDLNNAYDSSVSVELLFTLGSLTNVIMKFYVSMDGVTFLDAGDFSATNLYTVTASQTRAYMVQHSGWKFFAVGLTGTGTVTASSATLNFHYLRRGSQ